MAARRTWSIVVATVLLLACAGPARAGRTSTVPLPVPAGTNPSEPHLAVDPGDPSRLYAVIQTGAPEIFPFTQEVLWRSADAGRTWTASPPLGGAGNIDDNFSGDPVVAAGPHHRVLFGTLTFAPDATGESIAQTVGTRVSTDGGASFTAFGTADTGLFLLCLFDQSCTEPPPPDLQFLDKPWLAVDPQTGDAYLAWVRSHLDGSRDLLLSVSRDGGETYGAPVVLQRSSDEEMGVFEELAQLAVRPDGTVDAVWNGIRDGRRLILHAISTDGGRTFSAPETVVRLRPDADLEGVVTSLAVSARGRLGLCWSQARSPDTYDALVACRASDRSGRWGPATTPLGRRAPRQYLPAAAFRGEDLWVAAYTSDATATKVVAAPANGDDDLVVLNRWPVPAARICAPHPPDCQDGQTFIGDYIGFVGTGRQLTAAYVRPSADDSELNEVLATTLR